MLHSPENFILSRAMVCGLRHDTRTGSIKALPLLSGDKNKNSIYSHNLGEKKHGISLVCDSRHHHCASTYASNEYLKKKKKRTAPPHHMCLHDDGQSFNLATIDITLFTRKRRSTLGVYVMSPTKHHNHRHNHRQGY